MTSSLPSSKRAAGERVAPSRSSLVALALAGVLLVGTLVLLAFTWTDQVVSVLVESHLQHLVLAIGFATYSAVGALIVIRRPGSRVGWLLLAGGLCFQMWIFSMRYAAYGLVVEPGSLPGAEIMAWVLEWIGVPGFGFAFMLMLLVYPNGRLPSPRWRPVAWFVVAAISVATFTWATGLGPLPIFDQVTNPVGIETPDGIDSGLGWMLMVLGVLAAAVSLIVRYVRSAGVERKQIKWLAYAGALMFLALVTVTVGSTFDPIQAVAGILFLVAIAALPVAVGMAVLRYRLYEIDRLISRTVSYALVVGLLAAVFLGAVTLATVVLPAQSDLAIAASTLTVAALFNPMRKRVQGWVDRRFNRSRYDAQRVMDEFTDSLQDRVDPDGVVDGWISVVSKTMEPSSVSVWVKNPDKSSKLTRP
jgi:hypothetical protein